MRLIDCDVHPLIPDAGDSLTPFLPEVWRRKLGNRELALANPLPASRYSHPGGRVLRPDAQPPGGGAPGSDAEFVRREVLDGQGAAAAILLPIQGAGVAAWTNAGEAAALASAFNDYFIEHWLKLDERFRLAAVVAPQDPQAAAAEVRRLASTPQLAAIWIPLLDILLGQEHYHPIYDAAAEAGLPIVVHPNGTEGIYQGCPSFACGMPRSYAERFVDLHQLAQANLSSIVFEGVLDRWPSLRFAFTECGWTWLPAFLWRMDTTWKATRVEVPWVRERPSELVRQRVRFTTQPVDEPDKQHRYIAQIAEMMMAKDVLMFSSDYPHWDSEDVTRVVRVMPEELHDRVFFETAAETYGIDVLTHA
ncbi:MAG: amidohydrolase family protein [Thermoleophilaceae bacterium]